jgi:SagB-type dehydrogenase family enzyme
MRRLAGSLIVAAALLSACASPAPTAMLRGAPFGAAVALPSPETVGALPLESVLRQRRSAREFASTPLPVAVIGQLLWAAQGVTDAAGRRTAPSAGGRYPLELYVVTAGETLHYLPAKHRVESRPDADLRGALMTAALDQPAVGSAPAVIVIASVTKRTAVRYGAQARDFIEIEVGHAAQNILLQATALRLSAVPIGGFNAREIRTALALPPDEDVRYLIPVGYPAR